MQYIIDDVNYDANYESRKLNRCNDKIRDIAFDLKTLVVDLDRFRDDFPELTDEEFENC